MEVAIALPHESPRAVHTAVRLQWGIHVRVLRVVFVLVGLQQSVAIVHHAALVTGEAQLGVMKTCMPTERVGLGEHLGAVLALEPDGRDLTVRAAFAFDQTLFTVMWTHVRMVLEMILPVVTILEHGRTNRAAA